MSSFLVWLSVKIGEPGTKSGLSQPWALCVPNTSKPERADSGLRNRRSPRALFQSRSNYKMMKLEINMQKNDLNNVFGVHCTFKLQFDLFWSV